LTEVTLVDKTTMINPGEAARREPGKTRLMTIGLDKSR